MRDRVRMIVLLNDYSSHAARGARIHNYGEKASE